jgi:hypothetical protein
LRSAQVALDNAEAGASTLILEHVPPGVGVTEERAANLVPVLLSIFGRGSSIALLGTANGPTSLGNPDLLAVSDRLGLLNGVVEEGLGVLDAVLHGELVVRVSVETEPVEMVDDIGVGGVGPGIPGVDVTEGNVAQAGAGDSGANLLDVRDELLGLDTGAGVGLGASDRVTVHILRTDGDTDDQLGEVFTVLADGGLESGDLVLHVASGDPETEKQLGLLRNGGGDSLNGGVGGTALDHGVETGTGEAGLADEGLGGGEILLEVGLILAAAISLGGTVVEALGGGIDRRHGEGEGKKLNHLHYESDKRMSICDV